MGELVTVIDVVRDLDSFDSEAIICAKQPWAEDSQAMVIIDPQARRIPAEAESVGMTYFLEVFIARDFLIGWRANLNTEPTLQQKCARLIEYAITDV